MLHRIGQQGRAVQRGAIVQQLLGEGAGPLVGNKPLREGIDSIVNSLMKQDPDVGVVMRYLFPVDDDVVKLKAGWATDLLAMNNKIFKPAATHGLLLPRLSFHVRNKISSIWQAFSTPGASPIQAAGSVPGDIAGAIGDGLRHIGIGSKKTGHLGKALQFVDDAMDAAGGSIDDFRNLLVKGSKEIDPKMGKMLAEAVDEGVFEGFVRTEDLLRSWGRAESGVGGFARNWLEMGGEMTQGLESRMRLGMFLDLRNKGKGAREAAKITRDALLDYGILKGNPELYRNMRHLIPFLAFTAQSIPQQAKFLFQNPAVAVGLAQLFGQHSDEPIMPWIAEQPHIPIGRDEEGNPQFLTTLGLPVEVLADIPNLSDSPLTAGRQFEQGVIGSAHPLIKAAYGYVSGRDPFFGSLFGSYDKTPYVAQALGAPERSEAARQYREAASLGVIQPLVSAEQQVSRFFDPRTTPFEKVLQATTGARVVTSDPGKATRAILQERLSRLPGVGKGEFFFTKSEDEDLKALVEAARISK
jgi:hypothetical protein